MNRYSIGSIIGILVLWELLVKGLEIPKFLLPAPTTIISYVITKFRLLATHTAITLFFFPVLGPTFKALASAGASEMKWMDSYSASGWQKFWYLQFPFALPQVFASFKVAWTLAVIGGVVGEVLGAYKGLGFLIGDAIYIMDTPRVFASIIACSLLGLSFVGVITLIEKKTIAWHISAERR